MSHSRSHSASEPDGKCLVAKEGQSQLRGRARSFARKPFCNWRRPATDTDPCTMCNRCARYAQLPNFAPYLLNIKTEKFTPKLYVPGAIQPVMSKRPVRKPRFQFPRLHPVLLIHQLIQVMILLQFLFARHSMMRNALSLCSPRNSN